MDYDIQLAPLFGGLERFDVAQVAGASDHPWFNRTLAEVNQSYVRLGVFQPGDFHWHQHPGDDELFFVLEGRLAIDVRTPEGERCFELGPMQGLTVPADVEHRPRALEPTRVLMVESSQIQPTGS